MTALAHVSDTLAAWLNPTQPQNPHWSAATWQIFQFASRVHGVAPLLAEKLQDAPWLEHALKSWLAEQHQLNSQRLARMNLELREILSLFKGHGLPIMPLKGSIMGPAYYPQPGLRPMADLDMLVRPNDWAASVKLLGQLGYQQEVVHWKHTEFCKPDNRRVISTTGEHPDNPRKVELHLHCRETFGGPTVTLTELLWGNATPGTLLGQPAVLPQPEALWLHLLVHATYHLWQGKGRLIQLYDLALLTPPLSNPLPWLEAVEGRFTYPSLVLLNKYFPGIVDDHLLETQHRRVSSSFRQWAHSLNLVNTSHLNPNPPGPYLLRALKFSEGRPEEVVQALRFALLPSLEEIALDHPHLAQSRAPWLAYFLLPADWLKRFMVQR